jgi:hypothetical protein
VAAALGDELKVVAFRTFEVANTYTQAQADALLAAKQNASNNLTAYAATGVGFRNRIINGDMRIDQRNAGASVTVNSGTAQYAVDRFAGIGQATDGVFTVQQSTTAPAGFRNSIVATVTTADSSLGATQFYVLEQRIEGHNVADFGWGAAGAQSVTLSFWVRCSLTGTFGGALMNSAQNRAYPFSYTITAANTWEQKTVVITGDTSGTWLTTNGIGIELSWGLGVGSSFSAAAGSWAGQVAFSATGATNLMATNGATFFLTGVQLEAGTVATPFERRDYGRELIMCQRYYEKSYDIATAPGTNLNNTIGGFVGAVDPNPALNAITGGQFKVTKRAPPTVSFWSQLGVASQASGWQDNSVVITIVTTNPNVIGIDYVALATKPERLMRYQWAASAEL